MLEHIAADEPDFLLEDRARYYPFSYDAEDMPDLARAVERRCPTRTVTLSAGSGSSSIRGGRQRPPRCS